LKDLHEMFGDWHLSLAAYNTGEGNISRILGQGRADDFWEMSDRGYLYRETEDFVPEFLAALHIAATPQAYGFDTPDEEPLQYDLVTVKRSLPLTKVASLSGASTEMIKELNPALQRGMTPPTRYAIRVPRGTKDTFELAYANMSAPQPFTRRKMIARRVHKVGKGKPVGQRGHRGHIVAAASRPHVVRVASLRKGNVARNAHLGSNSAVLRAVHPSAAPVLAARHKLQARVLD